MMRKKTLVVRGDYGIGFEPLTMDVVMPIHISAVYKYPPIEKEFKPPIGELKYGRENNPTTILLEKEVARIESGDWALSFNSGMAAFSTLFLTLDFSGKVVVQKVVYGVTRTQAENIFGKLGKKVKVTGPPWDELIENISKTDLVVLETMGNPTLRIPPVREIIEHCNTIGCMVVVDNTFATPILYRPLEDGAFLVLESATKYFSGHNDVMAGFISGDDNEMFRLLWEARKQLGTHLQPLDAFLVIRGMKTLDIRFREVSSKALKIAEWLEGLDDIVRVYYPGLDSHPDHDNALELFKEKLFGGVLSFEIKGGRNRVMSFLRELELIIPSASFGGTETIISYPYITSHKSLTEEERKLAGISEGLLRLSVGLEDINDIVDDLEQALKKTR